MVDSNESKYGSPIPTPTPVAVNVTIPPTESRVSTASFKMLWNFDGSLHPFKFDNAV